MLNAPQITQVPKFELHLFMLRHKYHFLDLHLVEDIISLNCLTQWHELVRHETTRNISKDSFQDYNVLELTLVSAAFSSTSPKLRGRYS